MAILFFGDFAKISKKLIELSVNIKKKLLITFKQEK